MAYRLSALKTIMPFAVVLILPCLQSWFGPPGGRLGSGETAAVHSRIPSFLQLGSYHVPYLLSVRFLVRPPQTDEFGTSEPERKKGTHDVTVDNEQDVS